MEPLELVVYSDFLCPWCYCAALRLERVEASFGGAVALDWRAFLLRPRPRGDRDLERFRAYTRSWLRVAEEEPGAHFQVWQGDAGPPSHSVPAQLAAKAAQSLGGEAGRQMRWRLFRAYFAENRDISDPQTLFALWLELGLPEAEFDRCEDPALLRAVLSEHDEALGHGATGVPAARLSDSDFALVGAQPEATYRRWLERALAEGRPGA